MPDPKSIVINTSPLLALIAAFGDLKILQTLYSQIWVPYEVGQEITVDSASRFGASEFLAATWLNTQSSPISLSPFLANSLDRGEASVIQLALNESIPTVCIDETVGRRIAKLSGLSITGSVGILLKAKQLDPSLSVTHHIQRMQNQGIRLSQRLIQAALKQAGE
ncbi:MAG: DUF3368 domain-containing protein [Cyanobacteria bacterium P01_F01_bin.150]